MKGFAVIQVPNHRNGEGTLDMAEPPHRPVEGEHLSVQEAQQQAKTHSLVGTGNEHPVSLLRAVSSPLLPVDR